MTGLTPAGSTRAWRRTRLFVLDRDRWRCRVPDAAGTPCGRPLAGPLYPTSPWTAHVDHIHRRRDGGTDDPANLRGACWPCNRGRESGSTDSRSILEPVAGQLVDAGWSW